MLVNIKRFPSEEKQTLGLLNIHGDNKELLFSCVTLELPNKDNKNSISRINSGEYDCVKRFSEKYKNHFHILNVEGRSYILIHSGNFFSDTRGCILPGEYFTDINGDGFDDVGNSGNTMDKLNSILPDKFKLLVEDSELDIIRELYND